MRLIKTGYPNIFHGLDFIGRSDKLLNFLCLFTDPEQPGGVTFCGFPVMEAVTVEGIFMTFHLPGWTMYFRNSLEVMRVGLW